jgi:hypothetical protein
MTSAEHATDGGDRADWRERSVRFAALAVIFAGALLIASATIPSSQLASAVWRPRNSDISLVMTRGAAAANLEAPIADSARASSVCEHAQSSPNEIPSPLASPSASLSAAPLPPSLCAPQRGFNWAAVSERVSPSFQRDTAWPQFTAAHLAACSSQASAAPLRRLVKRIAEASRFSVLAIGGSSPAGIDCANELVEGKFCSWPGRLVDALRAVFKNTTFTYESFATGGMNHMSALASLPPWLAASPHADLLLVDFHINDSGFEPADALAYVESLVLAVQRMRPKLELLYVSSMCHSSGAAMNEVYKSVASAHSLPIVSFFDLVSAVGYIRSPDEADTFPRAKLSFGVSPWCAETTHKHPTWPIHQLIADSALGCLEAAWADLCSEPTRVATLSLQSKIMNVSCEVPALVISARQEWALRSSAAAAAATAAASAALVGNATVTPNIISSGGVGRTVACTSRDWDLVEDRKGKPGWVAAAPGAFIEFDVRFGQHPRLTISFLQSYRGLGAAVFRFLSRPDRAVTLDGLYSLLDPMLAQNVSQVTSLTMEVDSVWFQADLVTKDKPHGLGGSLGFGFPPFHSDVVRLEGAPNREAGAFKFKLVEISTC